MKTKEFFNTIKQLCKDGCIFTAYTDFDDIEVDTIKSITSEQFRAMVKKEDVAIIEDKNN